MNRRADMIVSGLVQGVGFRHMARGAARVPAQGRGRELGDETVRITCEGEEEEDIGRLVEAVRNAKKPIEVDDVQVEYSEPTGEFKNFRIIIGDQLMEMSGGFGTDAAYLRMALDRWDHAGQVGRRHQRDTLPLTQHARHEECAVPAT